MFRSTQSATRVRYPSSSTFGGLCEPLPKGSYSHCRTDAFARGAAEQNVSSDQADFNGNQGFFECRRLHWTRTLHPKLSLIALPQMNVAIDGLPSGRVATIERVVSDVRVQVQIVLIPDGVGLQETPKHRVIDPRFIVIELNLRQHGLTCIAEARARPRVGLPIRSVRIARRARPVLGDHRTQMISNETARSLSPAPSYQTIGSSTPGPCT
jgi:hypothetical protein